MRTDKNRRQNVPADARPDERRAGTRNARRAAKAELADLLADLEWEKYYVW